MADMVCLECGGTFNEMSLIKIGEKRICSGCKPVFLQKMREGVSLSGDMNYAGFWIRTGAKILDLLIMWVTNTVLGTLIVMVFFSRLSMMSGLKNQPHFNPLYFVQMGIMMLVQMLMQFGYTAWFLGKFAATPGKMALGLKVVMADKGRVSYKRALGRALSEVVSGLLLCIGYIMAGFDDEKRALHDRICNTRVVRK